MANRERRESAKTPRFNTENNRREGAPSVNLHLSRPPLLLFFLVPTLTPSLQLILEDTVRNNNNKKYCLI